MSYLRDNSLSIETRPASVPTARGSFMDRRGGGERLRCAGKRKRTEPDMGWWEQRASNWKMVIVAQVGGAAGFGAGAFFLMFKSASVPVKPVFLAVAGGVGVGGSIGSGVSIPWSDVVRQLINPRFHPDVANYGYADLRGTFSCQDIQREKIEFVQATASAILVGAQFVDVTCTEVNLFAPNRVLFTTRINIPSNLPQVGRALLDLPQVQGGLGAGAFAFIGTLFYIGTG
jgi:hypothetical protein